MPMIEAHIVEGFAPQDKARLRASLSDALRLVMPVAPEEVVVLLHEHAPEHGPRNEGRVAHLAARPDPAALVLSYLRAMEARDLEAAEACLGDGFEMHFPGRSPIVSLEALVEWARGRYREIAKTIEATETFQCGDATVVYVRGTLAGRWPDGTAFSGIRFIDRFEVQGGRLIRQDVWNDLAEARRA